MKKLLAHESKANGTDVLAGDDGRHDFLGQTFTLKNDAKGDIEVSEADERRSLLKDVELEVPTDERKKG